MACQRGEVGATTVGVLAKDCQVPVVPNAVMLRGHTRELAAHANVSESLADLISICF